jgi:hypothetical protein
MIQLGWEDGESLALRAKDREDHERLLKILGELGEGDQEADEMEMQTRKDRESTNAQT